MLLEREMMQVPVVPLHVPRVPRMTEEWPQLPRPRMTDETILARARRRRLERDEARKTAARKELNELEELRENGQRLDWDELAGLACVDNTPPRLRVLEQAASLAASLLVARNRKRKFMSLSL